MIEIVDTTDVEVAEQVLSSTYGSMQLAARGLQRGLWMASATVGSQAQLMQIRLALAFQAEVRGFDRLVISHLTAGHTAMGSGRGQRCYGPGDLYLAGQPAQSISALTEAMEIQTAVLDPVLLSEVADTAPARTRQPVRLTGFEPLPHAAAQWMSTFAHLRDLVFAQPDHEVDGLVVAGAARLLAAVTLTTFPNNALTDPTIEDRHDAHPDTLRRAVAFIDGHAQDDITAADIAAVAHVTIRAVQLAFRRHLDTTPMAYLRQVRLDHAHHDLLDADPAATTVTVIAGRWGFANPGRFAALYRQAYGILPSMTLHQN